MTSNAKLSLEDLRKLLKDSHIHCLVGYGLSEECGVPTFNDLLCGVWSVSSANLNPFVSEGNRQWVNKTLLWKRSIIRARSDAKPYRVLSLLQERLKLEVATQCVDGLIGLNGIKQAVELFGNVLANRCHVCGEYFAPAINIDIQSCTQCGGSVWPDIAMFGWNDHREVQDAWREQLPNAALLIRIGADPLLMPYGNVQAGNELQCSILELTVSEFRYVTDTGYKSVLSYEEVVRAIENQPPWPSSIPRPPREAGLSIGLYYLLWLAL